MVATTELFPLDHVDIRPVECPIETIQEAAARIFPCDEASQADLVSYVWEHWGRLRQVPLAMALAHGRQFAWRMRKKERSPLSRPTETIDQHCQANESATWPQELIESLPEHLRIVATLLAAGHNRAEVARLLATSKATVWRQCNEIRAYIEPMV